MTGKEIEIIMKAREATLDSLKHYITEGYSKDKLVQLVSSDSATITHSYSLALEKLFDDLRKSTILDWLKGSLAAFKGCIK